MRGDNHALVSDARAGLRRRIINKVDVDTLSGCWNWQGSLHPSGYGRVHTPWRKAERAHRAAYRAFCGPIPEGAEICHSCDNPACVAPSHLRVGSHQENMQDMIRRGRRKHAAGERNGQSKLNEGQVRAILASTRTNVALGKEYGVSDALISQIRAGKAWKHVRPTKC